MVILFFASILFLCAAVVQQYVGKGKVNENSLVLLILGSLAFHGSILFGTAIVIAHDRLSWSEVFGFSKRPILRAMLLGLVVSIVFLPVGMLLQELSLKTLDWLHVPTPIQPAIAEFDKAHSPASRAYLTFFAVILAPVAEEVFFRGTLYAAIKEYGYPRLALWGTAFIFAFVHLTPAIFLPLVLLSLLLCWLYDWTGNLLAPITAHATFNGINILLIMYGDDLFEWYQRLLHHIK